MMKCACDNDAIQHVFLVIRRTHPVGVGAETTYVDFYLCADCQRDDSETLTVQDDGHTVSWKYAETNYADLIPDGCELLEVDARDIPN